jgi:hypothetical protein
MVNNVSKDLVPSHQFLLYSNVDGEVKVDVLLKDETIWLTINQMADLFGVDRSGISRHIKNIFRTAELLEKVVCAKFAHTTQHGAILGKEQTRKLDFYNLDMIISVGYRVNSIRGTHFRIWATQQLKELIIKGFVLNNEKLKNPDNPFGKDYFDELLEEIRDIRSSEKRFYRKITDIYALAIDYNPKDEITQQFFKRVQNKLIYAATGNTAAEIIKNRSDAQKDNMGLTAWKGSRVLKVDVTVSKNYLQKDELAILNRIVTMYLDYAELQAMNQKQMFTKDWQEKLDAFLQFNNQDILNNAGTVTKKIADSLAVEEYEQYRQDRVLEQDKKDNDFDKAIKELKK